MTGQKRKLNLTIDEGILDLAKRVAELRGRSLSGLVEEFLGRLAEDTDQADWLARFHSRYLSKSTVEPSDMQLDKLRSKIKEKYS
jgi:hypothetical protein